MIKTAIIYLFLALGCSVTGWAAFSSGTVLLFSSFSVILIILGLFFAYAFLVCVAINMGMDTRNVGANQQAHIRREMNRAMGFSDASFIAAEMAKNSKKQVYRR
jgi:Sec-independent protein secretion pathway component TatC